MKLTITKTGKLTKCTLAKGETTVIISHDVTVITKKAFDSCREKITKLVVGEGVTTIEAEACRGMTALTELVLPSTLAAIHAQAFSGCTALQEVFLPDELKELGWHVFSGCTNLEKLHLPNTLTKLPPCIHGCDKMKTLKIPDSVTWIGPYALSETSIEEIVVAPSVEQIESEAFSRCKQLKKVTLPASVAEFGAGVFRDCTALEEVVLPAELKIPVGQKDTLGYFEGCTALKKASMTCEQAKKFLKATAAQMKKDSMPYKADKDKFDIFKDCTALEEIEFLEEDASRWSDGTCDFKTEADGDHLLRCLKPGILEYTVPDDVTVIGDKAFSDNTRLKRLHLNEKLRKINFRQFAQCKLESVNIPDSLTEVADNDFLALRYTNQYGKAEWPAITVSDTHPLYAVQDEMLFLKKDGAPHTLLYNMQPVRWTSLVVPEGVEMLAPACCEGGKYPGIKLPQSLRVIGSRALAGNNNLIQIELPEGVEEISDEAFVACRSLMELRIPASVVRFPKKPIAAKKTVILCEKDSAADAYAAQNGLDVRYPVVSEENGVKDEAALFDWGIGEEAQIISGFLGGTDDVMLPAVKEGITVKGYSEQLLDRVRKTVKRVVVPEGITKIPDRFFARCEFLEEVVLPSTLTAIGNLAFNCCWNLFELYIPESVTDISANAFGDTFGQKYLIIRGAWDSAAHKRAQEDGCRFVDIHADEDTQRLQRKFLTKINEDGTLIILSFFKDTGEDECIVPEQIGGRTVTGIARTFVSGFEQFASISLPKTIRSIEGRTVGNTQRLIIDPKNPHFKADDKMWYSEGGKVLEGVLRSARSESELGIPEGVEFITEGVFDGCMDLKRIHIPASVRGTYTYANTVSDDYCRIRFESLSIAGQHGSYAEYLARENKLTFLPDGESDQIHALRERFITHRVSEAWMKENTDQCSGKVDRGLAVGGYRGNDSEVWIPEEIAGEPIVRIYGWNCGQTLPKTVHIPAGVRQILPAKLAQEAVCVSADNPVFYSEDGKLYDREKKLLLSCPKDSDLTTFWPQMQEIREEALDDIQADVLAIPEGIKVWKDRKCGAGIRKLILPRSMQELEILRVKEVVLHDTQMLLLIYCGGCEKVTVLDEQERVRYIFTGSVLRAFESAAYGERYHIYLYQQLSEALGEQITSDEQVVPDVMLRWYNAQFDKIKNSDDKLRFAMYRLRAPYGLAEWSKEKITAYLRRTAKKAMQFAVDENDIEFLRVLIENGIVTGKNSQPLIDLLNEKNMVEWTAMLLEGTRKV